MSWGTPDQPHSLCDHSLLEIVAVKPRRVAIDGLKLCKLWMCPEFSHRTLFLYRQPVETFIIHSCSTVHLKDMHYVNSLVSYIEARPEINWRRSQGWCFVSLCFMLALCWLERIHLLYFHSTVSVNTASIQVVLAVSRCCAKIWNCSSNTSSRGGSNRWCFFPYRSLRHRLCSEQLQMFFTLCSPRYQLHCFLPPCCTSRDYVRQELNFVAQIVLKLKQPAVCCFRTVYLSPPCAVLTNS